MKEKHLSLWWEQTVEAPYVAVRSLVSSAQIERFKPISHLAVGYCSANFNPLLPQSQGTAFRYLVLGEKDPVQEVDPSDPAASQWVGGLVRNQPVEVIALLDISFSFTSIPARFQKLFDSDHVPFRKDSNKAVRVICGSFEDLKNDIVKTPQVTLLDVVLKQGGTFNYQVAPQQHCFLYGLGGKLHLGTPSEKGLVCGVDELIWTGKRTVTVRARCEGGRFLMGCLPSMGDRPKQKGAYQLEKLPPLDFVAQTSKQEEP